MGPGARARRFATGCSRCGAPVRWVEEPDAVAAGMDMAGIKVLLGITETVAVDVWFCTSCEATGLMSHDDD